MNLFEKFGEKVAACVSCKKIYGDTDEMLRGSNWEECDCGGKIWGMDSKILDLIFTLNNAGHKTRWSCYGHDEVLDETGANIQEDEDMGECLPYIMFEYSKDTLDLAVRVYELSKESNLKSILRFSVSHWDGLDRITIKCECGEYGPFWDMLKAKLEKNDDYDTMIDELLESLRQEFVSIIKKGLEMSVK